MIKQFYTGAIIICSILLIAYFIWYVDMIMTIDKYLESIQKGQVECVTDPMEIETVRYQMRDFFNKRENIKNIIMGLGITIIILSIIIILLGLYIQYVKFDGNISILPGLIILLFAVSVISTFKREQFTENKVLQEYDIKYTAMKDKIQSIVDSRYKDVSSLPEELLNGLVQRFKDYVYLNEEVVKMPLYSNYEVLNVLKEQLSLSDGHINVNELMKYLKFNADSSRTIKQRDDDGNETDTPTYLTDIDLIRPRDTRKPFVNDLSGTNTYNPYESLKSSLKSHTVVILVWTIIIGYLLFHLLYRTYTVNRNFTTIYTLGMIIFIVIILIRLFVSDYY